jgi:hypothetical protein
VPLAMHTGWNLRHPQIGASDQLLNLMGATTVPFAATKKNGKHAATRARQLPNATLPGTCTWNR